MTYVSDSDRLLALLKAALAEADVVGDTLIAAMLAECIDVMERDSGPRHDLP